MSYLNVLTGFELLVVLQSEKKKKSFEEKTARSVISCWKMLMQVALPYLVPLNIRRGSSRDDGSECCRLARLHVQILSWHLNGGRSCETV